MVVSRTVAAVLRLRRPMTVRILILRHMGLLVERKKRKKEEYLGFEGETLDDCVHVCRNHELVIGGVAAFLKSEGNNEALAQDNMALLARVHGDLEKQHQFQKRNSARDLIEVIDCYAQREFYTRTLELCMSHGTDRMKQDAMGKIAAHLQDVKDDDQVDDRVLELCLSHGSETVKREAMAMLAADVRAIGERQEQKAARKGDLLKVIDLHGQREADARTLALGLKHGTEAIVQGALAKLAAKLRVAKEEHQADARMLELCLAHGPTSMREDAMEMLAASLQGIKEQRQKKGPLTDYIFDEFNLVADVNTLKVCLIHGTESMKRQALAKASEHLEAARNGRPYEYRMFRLCMDHGTEAMKKEILAMLSAEMNAEVKKERKRAKAASSVYPDSPLSMSPYFQCRRRRGPSL